MAANKETTLAPAHDPFGLLLELNRVFDERRWTGFRWPALVRPAFEAKAWLPEIDVFEKEGRLVTRIDLPGLKKEDVKVEIADGHLAISGERATEEEEKKEHFYRSERSSGRFYRAVPLPDGAKVDDVKATFVNGVLEVSVPLPVKAEAKVRQVQIEDGGKAPKAA